MKKKSTFAISAFLIAVIGFSAGFSMTKVLIQSDITKAASQDTASVVSIQKDIPAPVVPTPEPTPAPEVKKAASPYPSTNCLKPKKAYADESDLDVGQDVPLDDMTYVPSDLVQLPTSMATSTICVKEDVAEALKTMFDAAKKDKHILKVSSGFRSYATQKAVMAENIKEGNKNALIAVAKPGYSEHQLGVAVDLTSPSISNASAVKKFEDTGEAAWLEDNAYLYGFIESYPEDKENVTGYMYEAWHYRFVGIDAALEIHTSGQTINQYLKEKKDAEKEKNTIPKE